MSTHRLRIAAVLCAAAVFALALPVAGASASTGELIVTESTVLSEDHHGWIRVWGEGSVLDCAGHEVIGDGSKHGIYVSADDVTIKNCTVSGAVSGIVMFGPWDGLVLENNRAHSNAVNGVALYSGTDVTAVHNKAFKNGQDGFKVRSTTGSVFTDNKAHMNGWSGFFITEASINNVFEANKATKNEWGFTVSAPIGTNVFIDNTANRNIYGDFAQADA